MAWRNVRSGAAIVLAAWGLLLACSASGGASGAKSCTPGTERCDCRAGGTCDPGLTCASNLCVKLPGTVGTGGKTDGGGAGGAGTDGGVDACTFACPTGSHWVEGTFKMDPASTGDFNLVGGQTISIVMSFEEGATFKDPVLANSYPERILLSSVTLQDSGDKNGQIDSYYDGTYPGPGELDSSYSTYIDFSVGFQQDSGNGTFSATVWCNNAPLKPGSDQYPVVAPFDCANAGIQFDETAITKVNAGSAKGSGSFKFH